MAGKPNKKKGASVYNRILHEFTVINNALPEDRKISLAERRKLISESIYPEYNHVSPSRIPIKKVRGSIFDELDKIPPKELCDVNYIDPSILPNIDVFGLDEYIKTVMPDCIYVKATAGEFGETRIFNTRNYNYIRSGLREIIENIRKAMEDGMLPSSIDWQGYKKLKKNKPNDGTPENYYIDFILNMDGTPIADATIVQFIPEKSREVYNKKRKYQSVMLERIKGLNAKKRRRKRATKTYKKGIDQIRRIKRKLKFVKKPETESMYRLALVSEFNKSNASLDKDFKKGLMTPEQYKIRKNDIYELFLKESKRLGGEI